MSDRNGLERVGARDRSGRRWAIGGAVVAAALGIGCGESGSCGGTGAIDGTYVSTDPSVTMAVLECDGEVSGTLTVSGVEYDLTGTRSGDEFEWSTSSADLCATLGYRRSLYSQGVAPFIVDEEADSFTGSFRLNDQNCVSLRAFSRGFTTTFDRI